MFHKMLKSSRNRQGFTLVEVIVVAVIVAILSAVAVPLYLGYINSAKVSTANAKRRSMCYVYKRLHVIRVLQP